jgi:hypothetical protein
MLWIFLPFPSLLSAARPDHAEQSSPEGIAAGEEQIARKAAHRIQD